MKTWKYYNHVMIPMTAPHEQPDEKELNNPDFWKENKNALFARWTTDFDCKEETNWWYIIRTAPYSEEDVSAKERKSIRQAIKKCYVKKINASENIDDLWNCYLSAFTKYKNYDNKLTEEEFMQLCRNTKLDWWGGYDAETEKMIGWMNICVYETYIELQTAKFNPEFSKRGVSDALYHCILDYYLNNEAKQYVCSGSRNINHETGTQAYKIRRFGYRKAYCRLHIKYNPKIKWIIKVLYPFRKLLEKFDGSVITYRINAVLKMEEICRSDEKSR